MDGYHLRAMSARVSNAKGTVVILGGRADFMERYFETARDLMAKGYCVASVICAAKAVPSGSPKSACAATSAASRNMTKTSGPS